MTLPYLLFIYLRTLFTLQVALYSTVDPWKQVTDNKIKYGDVNCSRWDDPRDLTYK